MWAWGRNDRGQLGIGAISNSQLPTVTKGLPFNVFRISAATDHAVALTDTGDVYQWGQGTPTAVKLPVSNQISFQHVAAGGESTIGLTGVLRSLLGEEIHSLLTGQEFSDVKLVLPVCRVFFF